MKKLIPLLVLVAGTVTGFAQGTVTFENNVAFASTDSTGGNRLLFLDSIGGTKLVGTQYTAELYAGADANSLQPLTASLARFRSATTTQPGRWNFTTGVGGVGVVLPVDVGGSIMLQVRVWENASGTVPFSLNVGKVSNVFSYTVPAVGSPPASYFMEGFQAFALQVPEPSAIALGVLGIAGLLLIRRRK
jgi:hypothetical protein